MMHWPTGIENCASGFVTNCRADFTPRIPLNHTEDLEYDWPSRRGIGPVPNLIVTAANVLELYVVRVQEEGTREARNSTEVKRGGIMDGVSAVSLELVCSYRFGSESIRPFKNTRLSFLYNFGLYFDFVVLFLFLNLCGSLLSEYWK